MANTLIQFYAPGNLNLTLELYPYGSDAIANGAGGDSATEKTNAHGLYQATVTQNITGLHNVVIVNPGNVVIANYVIDIVADDTNIYRASDDIAGVRALPVDEVFKRLMQGQKIGTVDTADLAATTTVFETDLVETSDDHFNDQTLTWGEGATNEGLSFFITASEGQTTNPNNKVKLTVETMPNVPGDNDPFVIMGTKGE